MHWISANNCPECPNECPGFVLDFIWYFKIKSYIFRVSFPRKEEKAFLAFRRQVQLCSKLVKVIWNYIETWHLVTRWQDHCAFVTAEKKSFLYDFLIFLLLLLLSAFNSKKFLFTRRDRTTDSPINNDLRTLSTSKIILFQTHFLVASRIRSDGVRLYPLWGCQRWWVLRWIWQWVARGGLVPGRIWRMVSGKSGRLFKP